MSNRLTFSLASLILIFALVFVATPAMAAAPTVTITEYTGPSDLDNPSSAAHSNSRSNFRVLIEADMSVSYNGQKAVQFQVGSGTLSPATLQTTPGNLAANQIAAVPGTTTQFVLQLPLIGATSTGVRVIANAGSFISSVGAIESVRKVEDFDAPSLIIGSTAAFGAIKMGTTQSTYTVPLVFTNDAVGANNPSEGTWTDLDNANWTSYITDAPDGGANITIVGPSNVDGTTTTKGTSTYTLTVQLLRGTDSVKLTVNPGFAAPTIPADPDATPPILVSSTVVTVPTGLPAPDVTAVAATNSAAPINKKARTNGDIDVTWTWDGDDDDLKEYTVTWGPTGGSETVEKDAKTYTIEGDDLRTSDYNIVVTAVATADSNLMNGVSDPVTISAPTAVPPAAPAVTATADDDANEITVSWAVATGFTAANYEVMQGTTDLSAQISISTNGKTASVVFGDGANETVPQGVSVAFSVTATDSDKLTSAAGTATAMLKTDVHPVVDISELSHAGSSFTVRFTYAVATMVEAADGSSMALDEDDYDALAVPTTVPVGSLNITTDAAGMNSANIPRVEPTDVQQLNNPNVFDVTISYVGASLPLYVSLDDTAMVSAIGISGGTHTFVPATPMPALMLTSSKTATIDIPSANSSSDLIPLGDYTIQPYDFFVLVRDIDASGIYAPGQHSTWVHSENVALPDLDWFFGTRVVRGVQTNGGTIALHGPAGETAKDLVFSEVMWGTDSSLAVDECSQWIEFYNATPTAINLSGYNIQFHRSQVPASRWSGAIDVVSNVNSNSPYFAPGTFPGQSGRSNVSDTQGALGVQTDIISMYRDLNEPRIRQFNVANRGERNKGIGGWKASQYPTANISPIHIATPGAYQIVHVNLTATNPNRRIIINEIGNSSNDEHDWIELHNTTNAGVGIENWELTRVYKDGSVGKEVRIVRLPKVTIPANSYVVLAASHPNNNGNDLAAGIDLSKGDADQQNRGLGTKPTNTTAYYLVNTNYKIGNVKIENNNTPYLYILRNHHDRLGSAGNVEDVVGTLSIPVRGDLPSGFTGYAAHARQLWDTATWPLQKWGGRHGNVIDHGNEDFRPGLVYQRNGKNSGIGEKHLSVRGYTGVGYDRMAAVDRENGGTPGYSNGALKDNKSDWADQVSFSEIMLETHTGTEATRIPRATRLPQWLEIYNSSMTEGVNLKGWKIEIQNADTEDLDTRDLHSTLTVQGDVIIQPNQTVLIVSSSGLNSGHFPSQRVINLFTNSAYRNTLTVTSRGDSVLSKVGFYIELRDHKGNHVDEIGNLNVTRDARRPGVETRDLGNFNTLWTIPSMLAADGHRTSLIRIYDKGKPNDGLKQVSTGDLVKGTEVGWRLASNTNFRNIPSLTYYGNHRDYGTPGYRGGGPLPVSLSKFRPQRLDDGSVAIRWVTESEKDNAGFNILRSDTRDGEFKKLNTQLIAGQGTTSERTAYEFTDKSAKPNVVYYYQIQDVSIDGNVTTLQTTHLRGHVSAAGKATTTWGELKALQ